MIKYDYEPLKSELENAITNVGKLIDLQSNISEISVSVNELNSDIDNVKNKLSNTAENLYDELNNLLKKAQNNVVDYETFESKLLSNEFLNLDINVNMETEATKYIVKAGDSLSQIAKNNGTTVSDLMAANSPITNPDLIYVGSEILIPNSQDNNRTKMQVEPKINESTSPTETTISNESNIINGNIINTNNPIATGTKYNLNDDQLAYLAYVAMKEQGSVEGAKVELSLMVNQYEKSGSSKSIDDYIRNSSWFASSSRNNYHYPGDSYVEAARDVINNGNRYVASNVVEHDCISDISSISTGDKTNRSNYKPGETIIYNRYGSKYVFVGFAPNGGDPFGYLV